MDALTRLTELLAEVNMTPLQRHWAEEYLREVAEGDENIEALKDEITDLKCEVSSLEDKVWDLEHQLDDLED